MPLFIILAATAILAGTGAQFCGKPCQSPVFVPPACPPTLVDGAFAKSLIDTLQLFMVSNLLDKKVKPIGRSEACVEADAACIVAPSCMPPCPTPCNSPFSPPCNLCLQPIPFLAPPMSPCDPISILPVFPTYECQCEEPCNPCRSPCYPCAKPCKPCPAPCKQCCKPCNPCNPCSYCSPCYGPSEETDCECLDLVLPPMFPQLPCGMGYLPAAVPVVAAAYSGCCSSYGANCNLLEGCIPIVSPCSCLTLATPVCPDIAELVKPIIM